MKHKHAELMALYAQDAAETDKPWERWEIRSEGSNYEWTPLTQDSTWSLSMEYRRKPQKIKRWLWLNTDNNYLHNRYLSVEEAVRYGDRNAGVMLRKLLWSEMEFEK